MHLYSQLLGRLRQKNCLSPGGGGYSELRYATALQPGPQSENLSQKKKSKISEQNTSKPNPTAYQKDNTPLSSEIYSRDTRMIQYTQINQYNASYQQNEAQKPYDHIN